MEMALAFELLMGMGLILREWQGITLQYIRVI